MFPARYFTGRFFPRRFWPKIGATIQSLRRIFRIDQTASDSAMFRGSAGGSSKIFH